MYDMNDHWQVALEAVQLSGSLAQRTRLKLPKRPSARSRSRYVGHSKMTVTSDFRPVRIQSVGSS